MANEGVRMDQQLTTAKGRGLRFSRCYIFLEQLDAEQAAMNT